ncbi:MAG: hypothetical protein WBL95_14850 [Microcoleus sp.]
MIESGLTQRQRNYVILSDSEESQTLATPLQWVSPVSVGAIGFGWLNVRQTCLPKNLV